MITDKEYEAKIKKAYDQYHLRETEILRNMKIAIEPLNRDYWKCDPETHKFESKLKKVYSQYNYANNC